MNNINDENLRYNCNFTNSFESNTYNFDGAKCLSIGNKAPNFKANTTFGECELSDYKRKMVSIL